MSPTQARQGAAGTKFGPPGPSEDLRGPQKGHFGPLLMTSSKWLVSAFLLAAVSEIQSTYRVRFVLGSWWQAGASMTMLLSLTSITSLATWLFPYPGVWLGKSIQRGCSNEEVYRLLTFLSPKSQVSPVKVMSLQVLLNIRSSMKVQSPILARLNTS